MRCKPLTEHLKPDNEIGAQLTFILFTNPRGHAPGQKLGVATHIGDKGIELLRPVWDHSLLGVNGHVVAASSDALRAA